MDNRLRTLQNLSRKDPYNVQLLQQYIMLLENTVGLSTNIKNPADLNKINILSLSRLSPIITTSLNKLNISISDIDFTKDFQDENAIVLDKIWPYQNQIFGLLLTSYIDTDELVQLQGISSSLYLTAHLHKGPCVTVNEYFPGYCIPMIQCSFRSFLRPPEQPRENPRLDNEIDVRINYDPEYPDAFGQPLYHADSLSAWQAVLESLFTTIEYFGRGNAWEQPSTQEITEFWNKCMSSWTSR